MRVSGGQQSNWAIHIHVSILLQAPLPTRLPHSIEQRSLHYTVGWVSILTCTAVCHIKRHCLLCLTTRTFHHPLLSSESDGIWLLTLPRRADPKASAMDCCVNTIPTLCPGPQSYSLGWGPQFAGQRSSHLSFTEACGGDRNSFGSWLGSYLH